MKQICVYLRSSAVKKFQKTKQPYFTDTSVKNKTICTDILIIENEKIYDHLQWIPDAISMNSFNQQIQLIHRQGFV